MAVGIIGLGRLGAALARGLALAGFGEVYGFSRTAAHAQQVADQAPGLVLLESAAEVLERCDPVFLWMGAPQAAEVLAANAEVTRRRRPLIVTCTSELSAEQLGPRWAQTLPNVNLASGEGGTLVTWGPGLTEAERETVRAPLRAAGAVYEVSAAELPFYSALASSGPAFYARIMETWADALADRHGLDREYCRQMVRQTVAGTVALQDGDGIDAAEVIRRVAHPGGSTGKGLAPLEAEFAATAEQMLGAMGRW